MQMTTLQKLHLDGSYVEEVFEFWIHSLSHFIHVALWLAPWIPYQQIWVCVLAGQHTSYVLSLTLYRKKKNG